MRRLLAILLENEAGALSRVIGLFAQRNYNIETLTVAPTEDATLSRVTLSTVVDDAAKLEQITKHLNRLIEVVKVVDLTDGDHVERELMLVKVRAEDDARQEVKRTCEVFRGQIVDVTPRHLHASAHRHVAQTRRLHSRFGRHPHLGGGSIRSFRRRPRREDLEFVTCRRAGPAKSTR